MLAPHRLCPTGIGNGEVQAVGIDVLPPPGGDDMPQRIAEAVGNDLGITGGAAAEKHQHRVGHLLIGGPLELVAVKFEFFLVEFDPAGQQRVAVDADLERA